VGEDGDGRGADGGAGDVGPADGDDGGAEGDGDPDALDGDVEEGPDPAPPAGVHVWVGGHSMASSGFGMPRLGT